MGTIEVFADIRCPFTHVGLRRFVERRDALGRTDVVLRLRAWPLELVNDAPLDPVMIGEEIDDSARPGRPGAVHRLRSPPVPDQLASRPHAGRQPPTSTASAVGERISLALRHALFEDGRDIADPVKCSARSQTRLASRCSTELPARRCSPIGTKAAQRGVVGSPHFFVGDAGFFCPSLDISRVDGELRIVFDIDVFDAFVERCCQP